MKSNPVHIDNFIKNIEEVQVLLSVHEKLTGKNVGKRKMEVLNKSCIVLLTACWEAFLEDLINESFLFLINNIHEWENFPKSIRIAASDTLRGADDPLKVWRLAGNGWKKVLSDYKNGILTGFNTPSAKKTDDLFRQIIGLRQISESWSWTGISMSKASLKLESLLKMRGDIAHRVSASKVVRKSDVENFLGFVHRLAVQSNNRVCDYLHSLNLPEPWSKYDIEIENE